MKYLDNYKKEEKEIDIIAKYIYDEISNIIECETYKIFDFQNFYEIKIYYNKLFNSSINILYEQIKLMKTFFDKFSIFCDFNNNCFNSHLCLKIYKNAYNKILIAAKSKKFNL